MRTLIERLPAFLLFALVLLLPRAASADPVVITGGFAETRNPAIVIFAGPSFSLTGGNFVAGSGAEKSFGGASVTVTPGGTVTSLITINIQNQLPFSRFILDGVTYNVSYDGTSLNFVTAPVILPLETTSSDVTLTTPFTMTGLLNTREGSPFNPPLFTTMISGQGVATLTLREGVGGPGTYGVVSIRYDFQPVPEPTTLLLFGAGLAGIIARSRRRST